MTMAMTPGGAPPASNVVRGIPRDETRYVIASAHDARALLRRVLGLRASRRATITVAVPYLTLAARSQLDARLTFLLTACGCVPGGACALVTIVWRAMTWLSQPAFSWSAAVVHFAWILGAALAGKVLGRMSARTLLAVALFRLGVRLSQRVTDRREVVA